ncbi:type III restriction endonuclease [Treponema ruminis]|uniref:Type III restriction enzyme n=1 Tax=Treponema ruminis TaxID=744515 RepID=A0A7W8LML8_9SPIR|nr:DEAD/DEAH box helicase family protein [Treponema ruminis]MBB5226550.1 type III restriction enzyme [Treponema ruminis]QSI02219.1 type III restriction endonuclease [Treponema ruminis]
MELEEQKSLYEQYENVKKSGLIPIPDVPDYIKNNLKYEFFEWQKEAFENFILNEKAREAKKINTPNHLMFNMATGTGKTLLMAALILYYYHEKGINKFIFFVNQNAIVGKTQSNFLEVNHNKYLFAENIEIDGIPIKIKEVEQFSNFSDDIQIKFTTIHKLHNSVYNEKENEVLLSDLMKKDIVLIADEAHHLNSSTSKGNDFEDLSFIGELKDGAKDEDVEKSWEKTVIYHLLDKEYKVENNQNVLLEFTATIPKEEAIQAKYKPLTIYKFDLPDFVRAGYTKEIGLIPSDGNKKQRILQALLFNWYRSQIALDYNIPNFKPVILFRSKLIDASKKDFEEFNQLIKNLKPEDFSFLNNLKVDESQSQSYQNKLIHITKINKYIHDKSISFIDIIAFLQREFDERNCLITNSKTNTTQKEKTDSETDRLLNSLEDPRNHIRAIFTVQRLTEGWDVLNLYDIVRLYEGRDEGHDKKSGKRISGSSTTSEVQLIGRGIRYYPFDYNNLQKNKRKFDNNTEHELHCLEEFNFHSDADERYIDELKRELRNKGLVNDKRIEKKFSFKKEFEQYVNGMMLFANEQIENPERKLTTLDDILNSSKAFVYEVKDSGLYSKLIQLHFEKNVDDEVLSVAETPEKHTLYKKFADFLEEKHIVFKALHILNLRTNSYFRFETLKEKQDVKSIDEFLQKIKEKEIQIVCDSRVTFESGLSNEEKLNCLVGFFEWLGAELETYDVPYKGSEFTLKPLIECFPEEKRNQSRMINMDNEDDKNKNLALEEKLQKLDWYANEGFWGTSEERALISYIENNLGNLNQNYSEIKLLRNEEIFKIYDFDHGQGFEPDFILFLKSKETAHFLQVFIEPKGEQLFEKDAWKNTFLNQIAEKYGVEKIVISEFEQYRLVALPFFNSNHIATKNQFEAKFQKLL